ncbi:MULTISPECIES: glycosyltransferase family 2 protein [Stenotrophomonas]|jgi:glycosyltransferase involved in cell wall biosynthesis|uniref:glycosyltransferase family 2 protein n=1 Tax=Stenotrophomonas TaxID=40323 RepID=UPI0010AA7909|nr:glycosyltransferase family 2 protein [Stenotrophomonas maltophilia]TIE19342.1 family 2 glycosyl transferase [Stenotrophomonas maltophilia]TIE60027.1 family 2 glycosyl transferase [Stenotrophomonas maltophilia]HEL7749807.1 glycosyltransferase [Stenotrophomonas maltophilia]
MSVLSNRTVPVFIISYNRVGYIRSVIERLEALDFQNLIVVDNASTYEPLLDYLNHSPHRVVRLDKNYGHLALWRSGRFDDVIQRERFILNDSDVMPAHDCPSDITEHLAELLERYPRHNKAGLSLRIDDLPDHYAFKQQVIAWESPFWQNLLEDGNYEAALDTTFALYRPGVHCDEERWWRSIRTAPPYSALHLPWYQDTSLISDEDMFYQQAVAGISSQWSITDPVLLKKQNTELQHEIAALKRTISELRGEVAPAGSTAWRNAVRSTLGATGLLPLVRRLRDNMKK